MHSVYSRNIVKSRIVSMMIFIITASVVLAGILASHPLTGKGSLAEHRFLFLGAGEAGTGIADLISAAILAESKDENMTLASARERLFFVDSKGMICQERGTEKLEAHKLHYAHSLKATLDYDGPVPKTFLEALEAVKPTAIIGVSAQGGAFNQEVIERLTELNEKPIIFALSNPTSKAECTATDAYTFSNGKCIFASGSPFDPVTLADGRTFVPGQGNNSYIFPAFGLASIAIDCLTITDDDFIIAARTLANLVPEEKLAVGCCYPDLSNIREVSLQIAAAVAENIYEHGRCELEVDKNILAGYDWVEHCRKYMYVPSY